MCFFFVFNDIFSKFAWVIPLKVKKGITFPTAFKNFLDESNSKSNKTWVDKSMQILQ